MRFVGFFLSCGVVIAACGGTTSDVDGGTDATAGDGAGQDGSGQDSGKDGSPITDSGGSDVVALDAAECTPPETACATVCPAGTYCLKASGPQEHDLGCTTIPPECNGTPSCACMADCFCPPVGLNKCTANQGFLICDNGTVSRRAFKKDIDYVTDAERAELASETLSMSLARYRYKTEPESENRHLGFIIDDQPPASPAVASDATHVDLYGYTSMLLATVQEQQKQIDDLKNRSTRFANSTERVSTPERVGGANRCDHSSSVSDRNRVVLRARARLGQVIRGKYKLEAVLGVGGMAVVYKATHKNKAEFAIKMLLPEISIDDEIRARFLREGYAANSVKHPGVVNIVDEDVTEDGAAFLVMELLDGASAEDLVAKNALPVEHATAIGIRVLDVLAAAHSRGVLHRDIKPANVFVTRRGDVKVLDFGIARVRDMPNASAKLTATGTAFGTPAFMAPEQARGRSREVREQTDLFAVGSTLFTLVTAQLVHEAETSAEAMIKAATEPPRPVSSVLPSIPADIAAVIDRALAFDPNARWPSAGEMRDALLAAHRASFAEPSAAALAAFCQANVDVDASGDHTTRRAELVAPGAVGRTTMTPTAHDSGRESRRTRGVVVVATFVGVLGIGGALIAAMRHPSAESQPQLANTTEVTKATPSVVEPPATIVPDAIGSVILVTDLPPTTKPTHTASAAAHAAAPHPSASSAKPNCNPNYVVDADGQKHFKTECFE